MGETRYFNEIDYLTKMAVSPSACHDHNYQDSTVFCFAAAARCAFAVLLWCLLDKDKEKILPVEINVSI